jgi:hypothetical protein
MLLPKILLVIALISTLFIIEKFDILYVKIPGFEKLQKIYLSQQDICGKEYQRGNPLESTCRHCKKIK